MPSELYKLLDISGPPLCPLPLNFREVLNHMGVANTDGLCEIYGKRNGFYTFEFALHIFPVRSCNNIIGLDEWNSMDGWRRGYGASVNECVFFGEDIFGTQFCIKGDGVFSFDPETAALNYLAGDIYGWAKIVLDDYEFLTGFPLGHKWQKQYGPLSHGMRLVPKIPFVLGGEYTLDNLRAMNSMEAMCFRAEIAAQIQNLPDGEKVRLRLIE